MSLAVSDAIDQLGARFSGVLIQPDHSGYDEARRVHNGLIDKRPLLIARCRNTADVVDALNLGRDQGLEIAVRGGGHNVAGRATVDGGLMIDLSLMKGIHVDPKARTARVQGGALWRRYNRETQLHGLASTGGVIGSTGVAGLTLGGGLGWLLGTQGLAIDNLRSAEIVLADGRVVTASAQENPDLFWAIRGGGGNFGIAASFEFNVHPVGPIITGGMAAHPFAKARDVLRFFRETTSSMPDELTVFAGLVHAPDGATKLAAMLACHSGALQAGEAAVRPIKAFGPPVMDVLGPMPYTAVNGMLDANFQAGSLNYWKSCFLSKLDDETIDTLVSCYETAPSPLTGIVLEHFHGAVTRVGVSDTACPHRAEGYNLLIAAQWINPADTNRCIDWARTSYSALSRFSASRRYVNYLGDDEPADAGLEAYGPNYDRLRQLKAKYDPSNLFHMNQNIKAS